MKQKKIMILLIGIISIANITNIEACPTDCDINVDSLFQKNISILKESIKERTRYIKDATEYIEIKDIDNRKFLFAVSFLSGIDVIYDFHIVWVTTVEMVTAIENWYNDKKERITCEKVKEAYLALEPKYFNNIEEILEYNVGLEKQLKIE